MRTETGGVKNGRPSADPRWPNLRIAIYCLESRRRCRRCYAVHLRVVVSEGPDIVDRKTKFWRFVAVSTPAASNLIEVREQHNWNRGWWRWSSAPTAAGAGSSAAAAPATTTDATTQRIIWVCPD